MKQKLLIIFSIVIIIIIFIFLSIISSYKTPITIPNFFNIPTPIPQIKQEKFIVLSTDPKINQKDVYPGEITISITTDKNILSSESFKLAITPSLPYSWKFINSYPTKQITVQIIGGLQTTTTYTLTLTDNNNNPVYTWSFTTSAAPAESSTQLVHDYEQNIMQNEYPLADFLPYNSTDFYINYTGKLTLVVHIKNQNVENVKQEVIDWIKSKSVDPSTHKIDYINDFETTPAP